MSDAEKKRGPILIVIILLLVLTILLVSVGAAYYFLVMYEGPAAAVTPVNKLTMDTYTVNLADNNFRRYVRLTMTLEYENERLAKELETKEHRINDTVISLLTSKRVADMADKEVVRVELEEAINNLLTTGQISGIYFEEFIIQ